jgi:hypothetical protein
MPESDTPSQLLVEGKNDQHVIWALCKQHDVSETFTVETPSKDNGGVDALIKSIPVRIKISGLTALGVVLDADTDVENRWNKIRGCLDQIGYSGLPDYPKPDGLIIADEELPRAGIWLMPNNNLPGMLENFVSELIPENDLLSTKAEDILSEIESENLNRYSLSHHQKAFIHTWLAWQKIPGQPMGQAITAKVLSHDQPIAQSFVDWLNLLFNQ